MTHNQTVLNVVDGYGGKLRKHMTANIFECLEENLITLEYVQSKDDTATLLRKNEFYFQDFKK